MAVIAAAVSSGVVNAAELGNIRYQRVATKV